jgi:hypothetical protein
MAGRYRPAVYRKKIYIPWGGMLMHITRRFALAGLTVLLIVVLTGPAFSATVAVGSCTTLVNFATIQQAIDAAPAGSIIKICPGTYREQPDIHKALNLQGVVYVTGDQVVIAPPAGGVVPQTVDISTTAALAAQLWVHNTTGVLISNITVDGAGNNLADCTNLAGILYENASGTVNHVAVRNETLGAGLEGCQSGQGIYVQTATGNTSTVTVENSSVHGYQKNGIVGREAGTNITVMGNFVQGSGVVPSGNAAQNGIELAFGAKGKISTNTVADNIYGDTTLADSSDILLYDAAESAAISVTLNTLGNSQIPIGLVTDTAGLGDGVSVTSNKIYGTSTADAIDVCTNGNTIKSNMIFNSAQSGVHFDGSCGGTGNSNVVSANTFVESSCAAILEDISTTGNTDSPNNYYTVPFTITTSTSRCTIPAGPAAAVTKTTNTLLTGGTTVHPKAGHKYQP